MFEKGKKARNELKLPTLHYVVADDWIEKLGHEAFVAWLKFHTWVDRTDKNREYDKIPRSLEETWELLGMSKSKFYRAVVRPLWNYGLIDIIEYEESKRKTQKPKNIIVYESPFNKHETEVKPLEKVRDYEKDYSSTSQVFGRKGGRPINDDSDGFKNETVENDSSNGFKNETVYGFKNETVTVSKMKPNNYTNISNNETNTLNNESNNKQQSDVVVDLFKNHMGVTISEEEAILVLNESINHNKDIKQAIQETVAWSSSNDEELKNPVGSVIYAIQKGWNINKQTYKPKAEQNESPIKYGKYAHLAEKSRVQKTDQPKESEEELAERQRRIQEKLKLMKEQLEQRKKQAQETL